MASHLCSSGPSRSFTWEDSILGAASASASIKAEWNTRRVKPAQGKEQGLLSGNRTAFATSPRSLLWSCGKAAVFPLVISERSFNVALYSKHLNFMPVLVMNVITRWTNQSIYPPLLLINSLYLCRANLKEWIQQFRGVPVERRCISPADAARKTVVGQGYRWLLATAEKADIKIVPATFSSPALSSPERLWQRKGSALQHYLERLMLKQRLNAPQNRANYCWKGMKRVHDNHC